MNSIEYVSTRLESMIQQGISKPDIIRAIGPECAGWPYVYGAWGEQCTPAGRRRRKRDDHPTIVSACQVLSGKRTTCDGCKWNLPVRMFDCRGFVHWLLEQVGIDIAGQGSNSQYNTKANWIARGPISEMPRDKVCCIFVRKNSVMEHVGFYLGDGTTVECSAGVQYFGQIKSKWTNYAIPAGLYDGGEIVPQPTSNKPTIRRGSSGVYVTLLQTALIQRGYTCGSSGADGVFGAKTESAVKAFQKDHGLTADGICGPKTWEAIDSATGIRLYTVHIPGLPLYKAEALIGQYDGAWSSEEGGA